MRPPLNANVNTWRVDPTKVTENAEIGDLTAAIGIGIVPPGADAEAVEAAMARLRYGKIVILADADIDGCFVGGTEIRTSDGNKTFETMERESRVHGILHRGPTFDAAAGALTEGHLASPRVTRHASELVVVELSDGSSEVCTPEHLWLLADGRWVAAGDLREGDVLECGEGRP